MKAIWKTKVPSEMEIAPRSYTVDTVDMACTVSTSDTVDTVYTIETAIIAYISHNHTTGGGVFSSWCTF